MNTQIKNFMSNFSEEDYIAIDTLCKNMNLSQKTVRKITYEIDDLLKRNGARLEKKYGKGIKLLVENRKLYEDFLVTNKDNFNCEGQDKRKEYILYILLLNDKYIKIDELCENLYVSRKSISMDIKKIQHFLDDYKLKVLSKPYYGIKVFGKEFDFRKCIQEYIFMLKKDKFQQIQKKFIKYNLIREILNEVIFQYGYDIYESEIKIIIVQIQIMIYRITNENRILMDELGKGRGLTETDINAAKEISRRIEIELNKSIFSIAEIKYLAILLSGKKRNSINQKENIVIDVEINKLVNAMIENVLSVFDINFYKDFELQTSLRQHLVSLRIRLQYNIQFKNPMLKNIKEIYAFPYMMASQACTVLAEYFNTIVSEDEIGYIAISFALSIERSKKIRNKKNIILVCESGVGSSKLFQYKFEENFRDYLNKVETITVRGLKNKNLDSYDYIFSTVPIDFNVSLPVYEIQYFFDNHSINKVKRLLDNNIEKSIVKYFKKDLFFVDLEGNSKEEVLHNLCETISKKVNLPIKFEEYVLKREKIMQTDLGENVAMPHPYYPLSDETFVSVAILKKAIHWHTHNVQVIFLLSISKNKKELEGLENFYNIVPMFMLDDNFIKMLIKEKNYNFLIKTIENIEKEVTDYERT